MLFHLVLPRFQDMADYGFITGLLQTTMVHKLSPDGADTSIMAQAVLCCDIKSL